MNEHSVANILRIIREIRRIGYRRLKFYSFRRWIGTIAINIYIEAPQRALNGEALYVSIICIEAKPDLSVAHPSIWGPSWLRADMNGEEAAKEFVDAYLTDKDAGDGLFQEDYAAWLDLAIDLCPYGTLPLTGEPRDLAYGRSATISRYPVDYSIEREISERNMPSLLVPPGLAGAINPYECFAFELNERSRREQDRRVKESFKRLSLLEKRSREAGTS